MKLALREQTKPVTRSSPKPRKISYPVATRKLAVRNYLSKHWSRQDVYDNIGCSANAFNKWLRKYETGAPMREEAHRPSLMSPKQKKALINTIKEKSESGVLLSMRQYDEKIKAAVNATRDDENKSPIKKLRRGYIRDFTISNGINVANAEVIDNAHLKVLHDTRHAASHAAMMHYLHQSTPTGLFFNMDKTSFEMRKDEQENKPAVYIGERPEPVKCDDPYSSGPRGNCSVHLYVVANDGGKVADMVYVVKDNNMPKDAIDVYETPMLDGVISAGASAYLLFVGESSPNRDEALQWQFSNIVVPFINQVRKKKGKKNTTPASLTVDGDPRQLQIITSETIRTAFKDANIIASKTPASCTPIFQPLDVGNLFKAAKTRFQTLLNEGYEPEDPEDKASLLKIFRAHRCKYPKTIKKNKQPSIAMGNYFTDVMKCLHTVAKAKVKTLDPEVVKKSFQNAGVSPNDPCTIRQKCKYAWTTEDKKCFDAAVPALSAVIARNSELKEKDFDDAHIPVKNESKDGLSVHRRRSLLLHAPHVLTDLQEQAAKRAKI